MPGRLKPARWALLALVAVPALALLAANMLFVSPAPYRPVGPTPHVDERDIADYAGDKACQECHSKEFTDHEATAHARTLRYMTKVDLGGQMPAPGVINGSQYSLVDDHGYFFDVNAPGTKFIALPIDFVFGSGSTGITFVSMYEARNVVELKMSYFPKERKWRVTPGQSTANPASPGDMGNLDQSHHCLACHLTAFSRNAFVPRPEFFGVGCEACHGPGKPHIASIRSNSPDIHMMRLQNKSAADLNMLCAKCHTSENDVAGAATLSKMTFRFQPLGIMQSRCFTGSGKRLSCLNCHDPHHDVSRDSASYVAACLKCHGQSALAAPAKPGTERARPCPVNARDGCVACHMPKRDVLSASGGVSGSLMTEHRIAVYPDATRPKPPGL